MNERDKYQGCLVGLAVGDALGVPLEFTKRDTMPLVTEMIGQGPFNLKPGEWTDDTSMALCLAQSLLDCKEFDAEDQMEKYWKWVEEGYMSSNGRMFDIGNTTSAALERYKKTKYGMAGSTDPRAAGNGSIMRLAPIPMFFRDHDQGGAVTRAKFSSRTTHGAVECVDSCTILSLMICSALFGAPKEHILGEEWPPSLVCDSVLNIASGSYKKKSRDEIKSSGYVLHTLEAALWAFYNSNTFEEGAILAVNLADDSDTTGAVYGQLAGAYYGYEAIPERWRKATAKLDMILDIANRLYDEKPER